MAAKVDPRNVESRHKSMHHFRRTRLGMLAMSSAQREAGRSSSSSAARSDRARVIDDTKIPKKGSTLGRGGEAVLRHVLGKQDSCQVAVSISLANDILKRAGCVFASTCPNFGHGTVRDGGSRAFPKEIKFLKEMLQIVARRDRSPLVADGALPVAPMVMDAGYGTTTELRDEFVTRNLEYVAVTFRAR